MGKSNKIEGEGSREAARHYNEQTQKFVESGKVEESAEEAGNLSETERREVESAEKEGKSHAKEKDPEVARDYSKPTK